MRASILTIGDELCIGQVINTNAAFIATALTRIGIEVNLHSVIGDDREIMLREIDRLLQSTDVLILTGGLGPTHDDITKPVLCEYFHDSLVLNVDVLENIRKLFVHRGFTLTDRDHDQALVPKSCTPIENKIGSAPGMLFEQNGKLLISLPGVPYEMREMTTDFVVPYLHAIVVKNNDFVVLYKSIHTAGIPESLLADLIGDPSEFLGNSTLAFLPSYRGLRLRIGNKGADFSSANMEIERIEQIIRARAEKYIIGVNDDELNHSAAKILQNHGLSIAVAESCTGGLLGATMTELPGASKYFIGGVISYSNAIKNRELNVSHDLLEKHGAVSGEVAHAMADNVRIKFGSDIGISITGIAGPDGATESKPVGTVWIGYSSTETSSAEKHLFVGNREVIRNRAVGAALLTLINKLKRLSD